MSDRVPSTELRRRILEKSGKSPAPHTRKMRTVPDLPPDLFPKTTRMKLVESQYSIIIEKVIFTGTIDEVAAKYSLDRSTVSKWRKYIKEQQFWINMRKE